MSFIFANIITNYSAVKKRITKMKTFYTYQETDAGQEVYASKISSESKNCIIRLNNLIINDINNKISGFYAPDFRFLLLPLAWDESGLPLQCTLQEDVNNIAGLGNIILSSNNTRKLSDKNEVIFSSKEFSGCLNILLLGIVFEREAELNKKVIREIKKPCKKAVLINWSKL